MLRCAVRHVFERYTSYLHVSSHHMLLTQSGGKIIYVVRATAHRVRVRHTYDDRIR